jgi:hypothetical protein
MDSADEVDHLEQAEEADNYKRQSGLEINSVQKELSMRSK